MHTEDGLSIVTLNFQRYISSIKEIVWFYSVQGRPNCTIYMMAALWPKSEARFQLCEPISREWDQISSCSFHEHIARDLSFLQVIFERFFLKIDEIVEYRCFQGQAGYTAMYTWWSVLASIVDLFSNLRASISETEKATFMKYSMHTEDGLRVVTLNFKRYISLSSRSTILHHIHDGRCMT